MPQHLKPASSVTWEDVADKARDLVFLPYVSMLTLKDLAALRIQAQRLHREETR